MEDKQTQNEIQEKTNSYMDFTSASSGLKRLAKTTSPTTSKKTKLSSKPSKPKLAGSSVPGKIVGAISKRASKVYKEPKLKTSPEVVAPTFFPEIPVVPEPQPKKQEIVTAPRVAPASAPTKPPKRKPASTPTPTPTPTPEVKPPVASPGLPQLPGPKNTETQLTFPWADREVPRPSRRKPASSAPRTPRPKKDPGQLEFPWMHDNNQGPEGLAEYFNTHFRQNISAAIKKIVPIIDKK